MIGLRKNRNYENIQARQMARNSMLVTGSTNENTIHISFGIGCFKGKDVRNLNSKDSLSVYNFLCSLFSFSLREFAEIAASRNEKSLSKRSERQSKFQAPNILVLIDATKIPLKALRIILRACQSALAYKIRQAIIVELEGFLGQQRAGIEIMLDSYDFKTTICPRSKLWKYLSAHNNFYYAVDTLNTKKPLFQDDHQWFDLRQNFNTYFENGHNSLEDSQKITCNNEKKFNLILTTSSACLEKFERKDNYILIKLIENNFDENLLNYTLKNKKQKRKLSFDTNFVSKVNEKHNCENSIQANKLLDKECQKKVESNENNLSNELKTEKINFKEELYKIKIRKKNLMCQNLDNQNVKKDFNLKNKYFDDVIHDLKNKENLNKLNLINNSHKKIKIASLKKEIANEKKNANEILNWIKSAKIISENFELQFLSKNQSICCNTLEKELNVEFCKHQELSRTTEKMVNRCLIINEKIKSIQVKLKNFEINEPDIFLNLTNENLCLNMIDSLENLVNTLYTKLKKQSIQIENYQKFEKAVVQFYKDSDELLTHLCSNSQTELDQSKIISEILQLRNKMNCVEQKINLVTETSKSFCTALHNKEEFICDSNSNNYDHVAQKIEFVANNLAKVEERKKRCCELVKLRISRLKQIEEIFKCENFEKEIIDKMNECYSFTNKSKTTLGLVKNNQKTEERLYDYAKHLSNTAFALRKLHGQKLCPNIALNERLERTWLKINQSHRDFK